MRKIVKVNFKENLKEYLYGKNKRNSCKDTFLRNIFEEKVLSKNLQGNILRKHHIRKCSKENLKENV